MKTAYAYDTDTNEVIAIITGKTEAAIEAKFARMFGDGLGLAYEGQAAFGAVDGLVLTLDVDTVDAGDTGSF